MKIYTRRGDKGITSLLGGTRVPKNHPRLAACGTVDEVISWTGLIRDQEILSSKSEVLLWIQDRLMTACAILASEQPGNHDMPRLAEADISRLEKEIDIIEEDLPVVHSFILPGGHTVSSYCHIARSVCRRSERLIVPLIRENEQEALLLVFINRLSDFFFVLARHVLKISGVKEINWNA